MKNTRGKPVAVVIGATSKWQSDGRNTLLAHGHPVDDSDVEVGVRWGVGGAVAQKFAQEGFFTVITTRSEKNAAPLDAAIRAQGGECMIVELDLVSQESIASAFATIRREAGDPDVLIYNAGYLEGRDLPPDQELLEYVPVEMLDTGLHISARGPFLVAQEVLPAMRKKGAGSFFFSNNSSSLRGKKRMTLAEAGGNPPSSSAECALFFRPTLASASLQFQAARSQPHQAQSALPMTSSRSRPLSHGNSSVNSVTHCRQETGMRVMSVPQKYRVGPNAS